MDSASYQISVVVTLDPAEYPSGDVRFHAARIRARVQEMVPDAAVAVRTDRLIPVGGGGWSVKA